MSPVSPVFHIAVTVSISLKTSFRVDIHSTNLHVYDSRQSTQFNSASSYSLFIWVQEGIQTEFQIEVHKPIQNLTENRLRRASGPVQNTHSITWVPTVFKLCLIVLKPEWIVIIFYHENIKNEDKKQPMAVHKEKQVEFEKQPVRYYELQAQLIPTDHPKLKPYLINSLLYACYQVSYST